MHRAPRLFVALVVALAGLVGLVPSPAAAAGTTPVTVVLTSSPNPNAVTEPVTLTATVTPPNPADDPVPTGSVTFKDNGTALGPAVALSNGKASVTFPFVTPGEHEITASYAGDATYEADDAVPRIQTVLASVSRLTWATDQGGFWSSPQNWSPQGTPVNGQEIVIDTSGEPNPSRMNIAGLTVEHITFIGTGTVLNAVNSNPLLTLSGSVHAQAVSPVAFRPILALTAGQHLVDGPITFENAVSGTGGIRKTGPGRLVLQGTSSANTFEGPVTVEGGSLYFNSPSTLGLAGGGVSVAEGGALEVDGTVTEDVTVEDGTIVGLSGSISAPVSLQGTTGIITADLGDVGLISGVVSGPAELRKTGGGTFTLSGDNSYSGGTIVADGGLLLSHANALGTGAARVEGGASLTSAGLTIANSITVADGGSLRVSTANAGHFTGTVSTEGATTLSASSVIHLDGVVLGDGSLLLANGTAARLSGSGSNAYQGSTSVGSNSVLTLAKSGGDTAVPGALSVTGTGKVLYAANEQIADSAAVTVAAGGVFDPAGFDDTIGSLTSAGSIGVDDDPSGTTSFHILRMGTLAITGGTTHFEVTGPTAGATHDQLVAGSVAVGGDLTVDGFDILQRGQSIKLIDNTGSSPISGQFNGLAEGATRQIGSVKAVFSYKGGDGNDFTLTVPVARSGYWMMDASGKVYPFGDAKHLGDISGSPLPAGVRPVDIEPTNDFNGYWILTTRGDVFPYNAPGIGNAVGKLQAGESATSISGSPNGSVWVFTDRGRAIPLGAAGHFGDMAGKPLNGPVLGSVATPTGQGYFMVANDGGIFAFGDAVFRGSMGGKQLNGPVVGLAPDPDNDGYWLVADDGGIFAFNAVFGGSMGGKPLNRPVIGMVAYGDGYLMVASDGGIFNFSTKPFKGSLGSNPPPVPVVAVAPLNES